MLITITLRIHKKLLHLDFQKLYILNTRQVVWPKFSLKIQETLKYYDNNRQLANDHMTDGFQQFNTTLYIQVFKGELNNFPWFLFDK